MKNGMTLETCWHGIFNVINLSEFCVPECNSEGKGDRHLNLVSLTWKVKQSGT